jgi:hypothetical protein
MFKRLLLSALALSLSLLFSNALAFTGALYSHPFSDIEETQWESAISFLYNEGIVDGYSDSTYRPDQEVNRVEFLKIVIESQFSGIPSADGTCGFEDLEAGAWYLQYVCFAEEEGIVSGYPDGTFQADNAVNLVEALKIIELSYGWFVSEDPDVWYANYVKVAEAANLIPEDVDSYDQGLTRGQMAELMARFISFNRGEWTGNVESIEGTVEEVVEEEVTEEIVEDEVIEEEEEEEETEVVATNYSFTSGTGDGEVGQVLVQKGEDWGLPTYLDFSESGTVYSGFGVPAQAASFDSALGFAAGGTGWKNYLGEDENAEIFLDNFFDNWDPDVSGEEHRIWFHGMTGICGGGGPDWLYEDYDIPRMIDVLTESYVESDLPGAQFYSWYVEVLSEDGNTLGIVENWISNWTGTYATTYAFWRSDYLEKRRDFWNKFTQEILNEDSRGLTHMITLNGECALLNNYLKYGLMSPEQIDYANESLVLNALEGDVGVNPIWLLSLGQGDRAYDKLADLAYAYGLGMGAMTSEYHNTYRFMQHFKNVVYDQDNETYVQTGDDPYGAKHVNINTFVDIESDLTDSATCSESSGWQHEDFNTYARYRVFQYLSLNALGLGFDSIEVPSASLPSEGNYCTDSSTSAKCSCDSSSYVVNAGFEYEDIENEGAPEFFEWMSVMIGRSAEDSPEAFCSLGQHGEAVPDGVDFYDAHDARISEEDWGVTSGSCAEDNGVEVCGYNNWAFVPRVSSTGMHCSMDMSQSDGQSEATLILSEARLGANTPSLDSKNWGDDGLVYEGRRVSSGSHMLYFDLDSDFASGGNSGGDFTVKVFFENEESGNGEFQLYYAGENGWTAGESASFDSGMDGIHSATFRIVDASFDGGGPGGNDLAIYSPASNGLAFLNVRVIRLDGEEVQ